MALSKRLRGLICIGLALGMVMTFAGCTQPVEQQPNDVPSGQNEQKKPENTDGPEPVTLSLYGPNGAGPDGVQTSEVFEMIREKTGISIDIEFSFNEEKFQSFLASDSLPDLVFFPSAGYFQQIIEGDLALNLDPYLEEHGQNIEKYVSTMLQYSRDYQSNDTGNLYFLNHQTSEKSALPAGTHVGPCLRWDYYKELGAPELKSDRDYVDVVVEMLKAHPTNEDGLTNVGISLWSDWGKWTPYCWGAYALNLNETYWPVTMRKSDSKLIDVYGDEGQFRYGMEFLNYAYRMGALDPDSFTQKLADVTAKAETAQIMSTVLTTADGGTKYLESKGLTGKGYTSQLTPVAIQGSHNAFYYYTPTGRAPYWMVAKRTQYPERCVDFLNALYTPEIYMEIVNGLEGVNWTKDANGNLQFTDEYYKRTKETGNDILTKYGNGFMTSWSFQDDAINPLNDKPYGVHLSDPAYYAKSFNTVQKDILDYYKADTPIDLIKSQFPEIPRDDSCVAWNIFSGAVLPDDMKLIDTNINNYMDTQYVKLAMCETEEAFEAEYEATIQHLKDLGLEEFRAYLTPLAEQALKEAKEILGE